MKHEYLLFGLVFNKPTIEQVIKKLVLSQNFKSSRSDGFYKKGVLRNFPKFTGKHPCQSLFFNKVACNFIKKETLAQVFSCEFFSKFLRTPFSHNTFGRQLLCIAENIHQYNAKLSRVTFFVNVNIFLCLTVSISDKVT